jgi:hypothetical protein
MKQGTKEASARGLGRSTWTALAAASAAVLFLVVGCGQQEDQTASTGAGTPQAAVAEQAPRAAAAVAASAPAPAAPEAATPAPATEEERSDTISIDAVPPAVSAVLSHVEAEPGEIIEVSAKGSSDVAEITLADGMEKPEPMTYDSTSGLWRTYYRVPLKVTTDRIGLSLTARNGLDRWRRVWVFVTVRGDESQQADSTATR